MQIRIFGFVREALQGSLPRLAKPTDIKQLVTSGVGVHGRHARSSVSCSHVSGLTPSSDSTLPELRVVTWNIEHGQLVDAAVEQLTTNPHLSNADVVLLQEMDDEAPAEIADALGMTHKYFAGCTHSGTGKPFGNAVLARGVITECEVVPLPHLARIMGQRRTAVRGTVQLDRLPGDVGIWSVHAEVSTLPHRRQMAQYTTVANAVAASSNTRTIVGGDFNTASSRSVRALVDAMASAGTERVNRTTGHTFTRFGRGFELDHIFTREFECVDVGVVRGHLASDHDPVWAVVRPHEPMTP